MADFGLSRQLAAEEDHYVTRARGKLPIRWLALETLLFLKFSTKSDVWAYGVLLWEIFTYGTLRPYRGTPVRELPALLSSGKRLPRPRDCPSDVFTLMLACWEWHADARPTFAQLKHTLRRLMEAEMFKGVELRLVAEQLEALTSSQV